MSVPPFTMEKPRFDLGEYQGRVRHFLDLTDAKLGFLTAAQAARARDIVRHFKETGERPDGFSDADMWNQRRIYEATYHPETDEVVPWPARMSTFVIVNIPVICGMLLTAPTLMNTVLFQWLNQSYNAGFNYCNRSGSGDANAGLTDEEIAVKDKEATTALVKAYFGACSASVAISVGLNESIKRARGIPAQRLALLQKCVPFFAVATAGVVNSTMMRWSETQTGIPVKDADGNTVGMSRKAGERALLLTGISRVALSAPILLLPPLVMGALDRMGAVTAQTPTRFRLPAQLLVIASSLSLALPFAVALFPPVVEVSPDSLEPHFHNRGFSSLFFSKGV